jgi:3-phenylpropionate/trans-cinnamate dioxygenase ferredoxin reductase component
MQAGVVVAGAGYAAGEMAVRLRQGGYAGPITMVGAESHLPYHRPPLSKTFLSGEAAADALLLRPAAAYEKLNIGFVANTRIGAIARAAHQVQLSDGTTLPYEKLVLATGGRARTLNCPGSDLDGLYTLRTIGDVDQIRGNLGPGKQLVIIGGGYIGLEVAAVAHKHGVQVTVVEAAPRVLARVAGMEISAFYEKAHRDAGVVIITGASVEEITASADDPTRLGGVTLADGTILAADFVVAGVGLIPNTELAEEAGLKVENGIWVDEYCRTEDPAILAIGDCSNHPCAFLGRRVRLESVPNALEQARVAADTINGKLLPYAAVPWFWSDQYDLKLQAVGLADGHDQVVLRGTMEARSFLVFYLRQGVLIAADAVNKPGEFMVAKRLVGAAVSAEAGKLSDPGMSLKDLLPKAA